MPLSAQMHCTPKKTIEAIIESGNHYVAQVKGNQKTLLEEVKNIIVSQIPLSTYELQQKGHGRDMTWQVSVFDASQSGKTAEWKNLKGVILVRRERTQGQKSVKKEAYFISDLALQSEEFHQGIRGHWGIENRLHWVKDVIHKEDSNGIKRENAPLNRAVLSTIAINIHRKNGQQSITYGQIKFGANVKELFKLIRT